MRKVLTFVILALLLVNCDKAPAPPASSAGSGDAVQRKLQELAGSGAADCGRISQAPDQVQAAGTCVMNAAKKKQAFYVIYEMPGLIVALGGDATGKLYSVQQAQPAGASPGSAAELTVAPCPSQLRIAQSGRVTCIAPGSMGGSTMGGASPHGGMSIPPEGGANPHGGTNLSPGGAPDRRGGNGDLPSAHSKSSP